MIQHISQAIINNPLSLMSVTWERIILDETGKCGETLIEIGG
jgi:hypothetical protein